MTENPNEPSAAQPEVPPPAVPQSPPPAPAPSPAQQQAVPPSPPPAGAGDAKIWAMACHLMALVGYVIPIPLANVLGPLVIWQIKKNEMPAVDEHGKESLNFQISVTIYALISLVLSFICIGFILLAALAIFGLVCVIIAAVNASNGKMYRYPLCLRMIK